MDESRIREWILDQTTERFYTDGLSNLTMDEVAGSAGISKKTLYKIIPSKNVLIMSVIGRQIDIVESKQREILSDSTLEFPGRLDAMVRAVSALLIRIQNNSVMDMMRLSPDIWELIKARRGKLLGSMVQILEEGRAEGRLRNDITPSFLARYFNEMIDSLVTPQAAFQEGLTPKELLDMTLGIMYNGILIPEGDVPQ